MASSSTPSSTALGAQEGPTNVREAGIDPNHWYPVAWARDVKRGKVIPATVWEEEIALYRSESGTLKAVQDACLHKGVALHLGAVAGERLVCAYHGWEFEGDGKCARIPYLPEGKRCPSVRIRSFPVKERYGIVWVFPGNAGLAEQTPLPAVPEFDDPSWMVIEIPAHFYAHFSICNENTMDVFHGHLHKGLQGWYDPELTALDRDETKVSAAYSVAYKSRLAKLLGVAPSGTEECRRTVYIDYTYPHFRNSLDDISALYLMRLPVGPQETRSFSLMFIKLGLPAWLWQPIKRPVSKILWHTLLKRFLDQDKEMVESEQAAYSDDPGARRVEINPAIVALQRLIRQRFDSSTAAPTEVSPASERRAS